MAFPLSLQVWSFKDLVVPASDAGSQNTITVVTGGTVFYSDQPGPSASNNQGTIALNASVTFTKTVYLRSASTSTVTIAPVELGPVVADPRMIPTTAGQIAVRQADGGWAPGALPTVTTSALASGVVAGATSFTLSSVPGPDVVANTRLIVDDRSPTAEVVQVLSVSGSTITLTAASAFSFPHNANVTVTAVHTSTYDIDHWGLYPLPNSGPYVEGWSALNNAVNTVSGFGGTISLQGGTYAVGFPLDLITETKLQGANIDTTALYANPNGAAISVSSVNTSTGAFTATAHGLTAQQPVWIGATSLPYQLSVSSVNTPANTLTITGHGLLDQTPIRVTATGIYPLKAASDSLGGTKSYDGLFTLYAHVVDANTIQVTAGPGTSAITLDNAATGVTVFALPAETMFYVNVIDANNFGLASTPGGTTIVPTSAGSGVSVYTTCWRYLQDYPSNRYNQAVLRLKASGKGGLPTRYDTVFGGTGRIFLRDMKITGSATDGATGVQYANGLLCSLNQPAYIDQVRISTFTSGYGICEVGTQQAQRHNLMTTRNEINRWYRGAEFVYEFGADAENAGRADCIFDQVSGFPVAIASVAGATIATSTPHGRLVGDLVRFSGVGAWPSYAYPACTGGAFPFISPARQYTVATVVDSTHLTLQDTSNATITLSSVPPGLKLEYMQSNQGCTQISIHGIHNEPFVKTAVTSVDTIGDTMTCANHLLAENQAIRMYPNTTPPAPLVADMTTYYAHIVDANTIQVMASPGGSAIDLTTSGASVGFTRGISSMETYSAQQLTVETNQWSPTDYCSKIKVYSGAGSSQQQYFATFRLRQIRLTDALAIGVDSDDHPLSRAVTTVNTGNGNLTVSAHGLIENQAVKIAATSFPTGLAANTWYYVHSIDNNTIQLRTTQNGSVTASYASAGSNVVLIAPGGWTANYLNREISDFIAGPYGGTSANNQKTYGLLVPTVGGGFTGLGTGAAAPQVILQPGTASTSNIAEFYDVNGILQSGVAPAGGPFVNLYQDVKQIAKPANPASGTRRLYVDSGSGAITSLDSTGTTHNLEAAGAGTRTDQLFAACGYTGISADIVAGSSLTPVAQTVYAAAVYLNAGDTVTNIVFFITTSQATLTTGVTGIYNSAFALQASSANDTALLNGSGGKSEALSSPYSVSSSGVYFLAVMVDGTITGAFQAESAGGNALVPLTGKPRRVWTQTGQASLPATATPVTGRSMILGWS